MKVEETPLAEGQDPRRPCQGVFAPDLSQALSLLLPYTQDGQEGPEAWSRWSEVLDTCPDLTIHPPTQVLESPSASMHGQDPIWPHGRLAHPLLV